MSHVLLLDMLYAEKIKITAVRFQATMFLLVGLEKSERADFPRQLPKNKTRFQKSSYAKVIESILLPKKKLVIE